jgi:hypothetical protein
MQFVLPIAAAFVLIVGVVQTQGQGRTLFGVGASTCGKWAAVDYDESTDWIAGFISGIGAAASPSGADLLNGVNAESVRGWMDDYCQAHPFESVEEAGAALRLRVSRKTRPEAPTQATLNAKICESQITDAYHLIIINHPQITTTITALEDMQCKGSPEACDVGENNRRSQIDANELEKSKETGMVLRALGCFQQKPLTAPPQHESMTPQSELLDPGLPDQDQ